MVLTLIQQGLGLRPREKRALCGKMRDTGPLVHPYWVNIQFKGSFTLYFWRKSLQLRAYIGLLAQIVRVGSMWYTFKILKKIRVFVKDLKNKMSIQQRDINLYYNWIRILGFDGRWTNPLTISLFPATHDRLTSRKCLTFWHACYVTLLKTSYNIFFCRNLAFILCSSQFLVDVSVHYKSARH